MMVTKEQIINGLIQYIDNVVIPALPTQGKWILGTYITLSMIKVNEMYDKFITSKLITELGIVDSNGMIDAESLLDALQMNARKHGKLMLNFPFVGNLTFCEQDIISLRGYILGRGTDNEGRTDRISERAFSQ